MFAHDVHIKLLLTLNLTKGKLKIWITTCISALQMQTYSAAYCLISGLCLNSFLGAASLLRLLLKIHT